MALNLYDELWKLIHEGFSIEEIDDELGYIEDEIANTNYGDEGNFEVDEEQ